MQFSERISRIAVSSTAAVVAKADQLKASGASVVDFGAGEPDFPTPENIKRAAVEALAQNFTKYTPTGGTRELKQAIVERHARDFGSAYAPEECLATVGGKQAIFEAVAATVNHGDEVILPVPYWTSFLDIIQYAGGKPVPLEDHLRQHGSLPLRPRRGAAAELIELAEASGLQGRGGAGFPTARKLRAVAGRRRPVVLANGAEGEPISAKDKVLLAHVPHLVLDGAVLAAAAVGADEVMIAVGAGADRAFAAVRGAIRERDRRRLDRVSIRLVAVPHDKGSII